MIRRSIRQAMRTPLHNTIAKIPARIVTRNGIRFRIAIESIKLTMVPIINEMVPKAKSSKLANVQML